MVVPSKIWGTVVTEAEVEVTETYSASCDVTTDVRMYASGAIGTGDDLEQPTRHRSASRHPAVRPGLHQPTLEEL